jgi:hypothetical protein
MDIKDNIKDIVKKDTLLYRDNINVNNGVFFNRLEKLNIAIYLITDFMSDREPLKFSLRQKSIDCLSFSFLEKKSVSEINNLFSEIISLLKTALVSKLVSEMNFNIINNEYSNVLKSLNENNFNNKIIFDEDFFGASKIENKEIIYKGQNNLKDIIKDTKVISKTEKVIKDIIKDKKNIKDNKDKTERQQLIIDFIKKEKQVSIKDISEKIKNCSEKTLQRELINLVNKNVLKKEGERRWSKYSLV